MWQILLSLLALGCGVQAMRAKRLLAAALWLVGVSAAVATLIYSLGAVQVAVIELSVGAGLVTVLFVFAIALAGEEAMSAQAIVPRLLVLGLVIGLFAVLGIGFANQLPVVNNQSVQNEAVLAQADAFSQTLWQERGLDMLVQVGLIFAGVMGVLGLLAEQKQPVLSAKEAEASGRAPQKTVSLSSPFTRQ